ncbi:MAG: hypothetical protein VW879_16145 [Opitutae bacterium]
MKFRFLFSSIFMLVVFVEIGASESSQLERFKDFETQLNNVTLTGFFTVVGKDKPPAEESYTILSVSKLGKGDLWVFNTLMKKNGQEVQLPIPLPVKWVGDKPVIHMDNLNIPTMGTFSAYVLFDDDQYAGTWAHGKTKGHLYGIIEARSN